MFAETGWAAATSQCHCWACGYSPSSQCSRHSTGSRCDGALSSAARPRPRMAQGSQSCQSCRSCRIRSILSCGAAFSSRHLVVLTRARRQLRVASHGWSICAPETPAQLSRKSRLPRRPLALRQPCRDHVLAFELKPKSHCARRLAQSPCTEKREQEASQA